ncbi:MAG: hypothetical protein M1132_10905 [Chloroflexi bacterium]|nr:hypothetical protein [Chloroflexota bacterium]
MNRGRDVASQSWSHMWAWVWRGIIFLGVLAILTFARVGTDLLELAPTEQVLSEPAIVYVTATPKPTITLGPPPVLTNTQLGPTIAPATNAQPAATPPRLPLASPVPLGATAIAKPSAHPQIEASQACGDCHTQFQRAPASGGHYPPNQ